MAALAVASTITACSTVINKDDSNGRSNISSDLRSDPIVVETQIPEERQVKKVAPSTPELGEEFILRCRQVGTTDEYNCVRKKEWNPFK